MPLAVLLSPEAEQDLNDIADFIAQDSIERALHYIDRIVEACQAIGKAPYRGTSREDLGPGIRITGFERRATIVFEVTEQVTIIRIRYAGRLA